MSIAVIVRAISHRQLVIGISGLVSGMLAAFILR